MLAQNIFNRRRSPDGLKTPIKSKCQILTLDHFAVVWAVYGRQQPAHVIDATAVIFRDVFLHQNLFCQETS